MNSGIEEIKKLLKANGRSITKTRLAVFDALKGREPLSMNQLMRRLPDVDRSSVYRTIELFEQLGAAHRVYIGWKYKLELTDKFVAHHHHLTCVNCGRTIVMNEAELERMIAALAASHNVKPISHQIEIQGICPDCDRAC